MGSFKKQIIKIELVYLLYCAKNTLENTWENCLETFLDFSRKELFKNIFGTLAKTTYLHISCIV